MLGMALMKLGVLSGERSNAFYRKLMLAGYAIGIGIFDLIEPWLADSHYWGAYQTSREWFDSYGVWAIFVAGFSPIPYKVFTIAAGVAAFRLAGFLLVVAVIGVLAWIMVRG